ncbi:hypothetical protein HDE77_001020 [Rhodanobacter sp. MP7CTX1]|nr:hypothetical protein [Rhodanobacter sp. MP7CTX1]
MGDNPQSRVDLELYLPRTPVISGAETARIMGFSTTEALYKARQAGRLPIDLFRLPGRRGWFAATPAVREWLHGVMSEGGVGTNPGDRR